MTAQEFEKIYSESYRAVYWTAMALLRNAEDAEDIVQDTFVAFIESYGNLEDTSKATALLKKIAANKSLNRLKLTKTVNVEEEFFESVEELPEDFLPDSLVESAEMRKVIMDIIEKSLSEEIRKTLILYYFDEMTTKEISEALGVPQGTILWRLSFAKKKIKKEVEKYEEDNDTKLFMVVPFLSNLFIKEAEQVPLKPMPASLLNLLSASAEASTVGAVSTVAAEAAKKGTGIMMKKTIITCISIVLVGGVATGIFLATRKDDKEETKKKKKKDENEIAAIATDEDEKDKEDESGANGGKKGGNAGSSDAGSTEETYEFGSDEYWLSLMYLVDVNDEAVLRKIADTLFSCEPKLGEDKHILYDKVVASIDKDPWGTSMWSNHQTYDFEFGTEAGYDGYDRLVDFGYWNYETEPNPDIADPGVVIGYDTSLDYGNPTRKGSGSFLIRIYDEDRAQKAYDFYCDYITGYYAEFSPAVVDDALGYCLKCGDGPLEFYAYVRMLHPDDSDYWDVYVENYFADPELMAANEKNHPADTDTTATT